MTDPVQSFAQAVAELEQLQATLARTTKAMEGDWRRELIKLRRNLQSQIGAVAVALGDCGSLGAGSAIDKQLREALSAMRSAVALHQANWPAVSIDPANAAYVQSTAAVRTANRAFIDLARQALRSGRASPKSTDGSGE